MVDSDLPETFYAEPAESFDPRKIPVRFSSLKQMARSPAHYKHAASSGWEQSLSMRLGSGAHAMLLGKPWVVYGGKVRRGKVWDKFEADNSGAVILNASEYRQSKAMVDSIKAHHRAMELLEGCKFEKTLRWKSELQDRECSGTPDAFNDGRVVELKTGRTAEPEQFKRQARWMNYHAQLAWYRDGVLRSGLGTPSELYIVAVESSPPYPVTTLRLHDNAIDVGERLCRLWLERLIVCERFNTWPGYAESDVVLDVEDDSELTISIDGEDVEF